MGVPTSLVRPQGWKALVCGVAIAGAALAGSPAGAAPTVPGAPTITGVTAGLRSVMVTYSAPASDGGATITDYRVACSSSDGGASKSTTEHASPTIVRNLTAGKTYTCNVMARNKAGYGPPSAQSAPVVTLSPPPTPTVPGAPTITSVVAGVKTLTVTYSPPASDGGSKILAVQGRLLVERRWREPVDDRARVADQGAQPHGGQDVHVQRRGGKPQGIRAAVGAVGSGRDPVAARYHRAGCSDDHVGHCRGPQRDGGVHAAGQQRWCVDLLVQGNVHVEQRRPHPLELAEPLVDPGRRPERGEDLHLHGGGEEPQGFRSGIGAFGCGHDARRTERSAARLGSTARGYEGDGHRRLRPPVAASALHATMPVAWGRQTRLKRAPRAWGAASASCPAFDGVRAVAVLLVVAYHFRHLLDPWTTHYVRRP